MALPKYQSTGPGAVCEHHSPNEAYCGQPAKYRKSTLGEWEAGGNPSFLCNVHYTLFIGATTVGVVEGNQVKRFYVVYSTALGLTSADHEIARCRAQAKKLARESTGTTIFIMSPVEAYSTGEPEVNTVNIDEFPEK